ncbi:MAG: N-acetylmuramoyl-L-alanine amidase [Haliscomenobacter sp.]|nr:N-acetylmuramoyl-L-alanine amidase [Haliscomenobacter sp.]
MRQYSIRSFLTKLVLLLPLALAGFNTAPACLPGKVIKEWAVATNGPEIKTVVIDAGHGGHDPGCSGSSSKEKHIALSIAQKLAAKIRAQFPEVNVILTRDSDVFIPLHERAAIANRNHADLFISIHCNFMPGSSATAGSETYVMGLHTAEYNLQVAKRENAAILLEENYEQHYDYDPNSPEGHIMLAMFQNAFMEQSILFAEQVENRLHTQAQRKSRGVKQAGFVVLKATSMPSVLVETGFLSNLHEEQFLSAEAGQQEIAGSLATAFAEYKAAMEGNNLLVRNTEPYAAPRVVLASNATAPEPMKSEPKAKVNTPPPAQVYGPVPSSLKTGSAAPQVKEPANPKPAAGQFKFFVQMAASSQTPSATDQRFAQLPYAVEVVREDNLYKYRTKQHLTLPDALGAREQIRALGFPDAFVVVYLNGSRIPLDTAKKMLGVP